MKNAFLRTLSAATLIGLAASAVSAQSFNVPLTPDASGAAAQIQSDKMLAALARVPVGEYTNNEMLRIDEARKDNDTSVLNFYLSHTNRLSQTGNVSAAPAPRGNPMTQSDLNDN